MPTEIIVRNCAPTLAGLAAGNLFTYRYETIDELYTDIAGRNRLLNKKGVYFEIVKITDERALVYVYRKKQLAEILKSSEIRAFLNEYGYFDFTVEGVIERLKIRLLAKDFPHEIGLLLGYPLDDTKAFIENKGQNCKCCGTWKAYNNVEEAKKQFAKNKKCTTVYFKMFTQGTGIDRLTVAGK